MEPRGDVVVVEQGYKLHSLRLAIAKLVPFDFNRKRYVATLIFTDEQPLLISPISEDSRISMISNTF